MEIHKNRESPDFHALPLPTVLSGRYIITALPEGQLYFERKGVRRAIGNRGEWSVPRAIIADKHWLYVNDTSIVYRTHPGTGKWEQFGCLPISSLPRAIWIEGDWFYGACRSTLADGKLFVDIYRFKISNPKMKAQLVAPRVRMDVPSDLESPDKEVYIDVP